MRTGDYILIIEDESPAQRVERTREKASKRKAPSRTHYVAHADVVDKVTNKKVKLKIDKTAEFDDKGTETAASRSGRANAGEPARKALICPRDVFQLPRGMEATVAWVSIDSATLAAIQRHHDAEMKRREPDGPADRR
jgi:hypothetical protein